MENDFISRQAAIRIVCEDECEDCPAGGCEMYRRMKRLPAADVRPVVRGKWIKRDCYCFCSKCGERKAVAWTTTADDLVNVYRMKFCPNCGADMRAVKSDEK